MSFWHSSTERNLNLRLFSSKNLTFIDHRGVVFHLVGFPIAMPLDLEMIRPGEGEVMAAKRLLERVLLRYGRFFDVALADALYTEAPFYNLCLQHHKDVISVLKGEQRLLLQDVEGVFSLMKPTTWKEGQSEIRAWDAEGFTTAEGIPVPLRVLHTEETVSKRHRKNHRWTEETEVHSWWWVTTIPISRMPTRTLWEIAHRRWEIENDLFHTLVTYWSLGHCFKHDPMAILNFVLTLFIAFILVQSFYTAHPSDLDRLGERTPFRVNPHGHSCSVGLITRRLAPHLLSFRSCGLLSLPSRGKGEVLSLRRFLPRFSLKNPLRKCLLSLLGPPHNDLPLPRTRFPRSRYRCHPQLRNPRLVVDFS